jgi:hypothetical protein
MEHLSDIWITKRKKRVNYERVRFVIAQIKDMIKTERDKDVKKVLAEAGISLNKLLLK